MEKKEKSLTMNAWWRSGVERAVARERGTRVVIRILWRDELDVLNTGEEIKLP